MASTPAVANTVAIIVSEASRWSWRFDKDVPSFDDSAPLAVMDGDCALCCWGAMMIDRADKAGNIRITAANSSLGRALFIHFDLNPDDPESWLFLDGGRAYSGFEGMVQVGIRCGGPLAYLRILMILPASLRRWLYARIARNRIAVFGKDDICALPDPGLRARLIE